MYLAKCRLRAIVGRNCDKFKILVNQWISKMVTENQQVDLELGKKLAAKAAIEDREFKGKMTIGIGSGSTVVYAVEFIAEMLKKLKNNGANEDLRVTCVPSSYQARQLIDQYDLILGDFNTDSQILWTIDGADEVAIKDNVLIKGGGGCLTQEKVLAAMSQDLYIIADHTKASQYLGQNWNKGIPIEVLPFCYAAVKRKIEGKFGGSAVLRMAVKKAGPVVTDNGNFILDWLFPNIITDWKQTEIDIKLIPGILEIGLFNQMATTVYLGKAGGSVEKYEYRSH